MTAKGSKLARFLQMDNPIPQGPKKRGPKPLSGGQTLRDYTLTCPDPRCAGLLGQLIQAVSNEAARKQLQQRGFKCPHCHFRPIVHSVAHLLARPG